MESLKINNFIEILRSKDINTFTFQDFKQLFPSITDAGLSAALKRLAKTKTITRLEKGKFMFLLAKKQPDEYTLANFIYQPSYISLETALSFYGIIDQFTYQITSVTTKKTKLKSFEQKEFSYSHIDKKYYTDYHLQDGYLIASFNKALFDYYYMTYKGIRSKQNIKLINLNHSQKRDFIKYSKTFQNIKLIEFIKQNI